MLFCLAALTKRRARCLLLQSQDSSFEALSPLSFEVRRLDIYCLDCPELPHLELSLLQRWFLLAQVGGWDRLMIASG